MIDQAVTRGAALLARRQRPSGEIPIAVAADHEGGDWVPDPTVFATAVVAVCLRGVPDRQAEEVLGRAQRFLRDEMHPSGVWRFWQSAHPLGAVIPYDTDDTATALVALGRDSAVYARSVRMLLANRRADGLFYTWLVPHRARLSRDPHHWRCALSGLRDPVRRFGFWRMTEAAPGDVDAVVCANALLAVGERPETAATVEHLCRIVTGGREQGSDKWYPRPLALHHALARAAARGVPSLARCRDAAIARILAARRGDGGFGADDLDTALAVSALCDWKHRGPEAGAGADSLLAAQDEEGGWPSCVYYAGGPKNVTRWGSAELTTGFCVAALDAVRGPAGG